MDFRVVQPEQLTWGSWYRGQPLARLPAGAKVVVQTPTCACKVQVAGSGMYRLDMRLDARVPSHRDFCQWVADIEDSAASATELVQWRSQKSRSTTVYNGNMRLMAFSDTLAFDADGKVSANLIDAASAACLVELQGCWSTEARWGLRWKVVQVKFGLSPPDPSDDGLGDEPDSKRHQSEAAFAFLDD